MIEFSYTVKDENGIHARPAGVVVGCAKKYESDVRIKKGEKSADGKRLISVMGLAAKCGERLDFSVEGNDEKEAAQALMKVLSENVG